MMFSLFVQPACNIPNSQCCFATKLIACKMPITQKELHQWHFIFFHFFMYSNFSFLNFGGGLVAQSMSLGVRHPGLAAGYVTLADHFTSVK